MKIERVEVFGVAVPLVGEFKNAYLSKSVVRKAPSCASPRPAAWSGSATSIRRRVIRRRASTITCACSQSQLEPLLIGMDPDQHPSHPARIEPAVEGFLDSKAAIEMACVDLAARVAGMPVYTYLGGAVKDKLLFNAWIGILPPEKAAAGNAGLEEAAVSARPRSRSAATSKPTATASRRCAKRSGPDFSIRIDANAGYDADTVDQARANWSRRTSCSCSSSRCRRTISPAWRGCARQPTPSACRSWPTNRCSIMPA